MNNTVEFSDGNLEINGSSLNYTVLAAEIDRIYLCSMEDEIHHGDERFHILIMNNSFILVGPFVDGAINAVDALTHNNLQIDVERYTVRRVPFRFREPGFLGFRLFPVPGLCIGKIKDLKKFYLTRLEEEHVQ